MLLSFLRQLLQVTAILLLAVGLRLLYLGTGNIWLDEAAEFWAAAEKLPKLFDTTRYAILDPPLYTYFLHFWSKLGVSEFNLRFPSVIFSLLGVAGVVAIGFELGGVRTGLLAGLLLAVSPTDIRYAQEVGQYALMLSMVIWNYYALTLIFLSEQPGWRSYLFWSGLALLATYTQYIAFFAVVIPFGIHILIGLLNKKRNLIVRGSITLLCYAIGLLPLIVYYLPYQLGFAQHIGALKSTITPSFGLLTDLSLFVVHKVSFLFTGWPFTYIPSWIPFGIVTILYIENLVNFSRSTKVNRIWLFCLTGLFAIYSIASLGDTDAGKFRHGIFLSAVVIPWISLRLSELSRRGWKKWLSISFLIALVSISLISSPQIGIRDSLYPDRPWPWPEKNPNFKPAVRYWIENSQANEPVYIYYASVPSFRYYLHIFEADWCLEDTTKISCPADRVINGEWFRSKPRNAKINSIKRSIPDQTDSFWLFLSNVYSNEDEVILRGLRSEYTVIDQSIAPGVQLYHLERITRSVDG